MEYIIDYKGNELRIVMDSVNITIYNSNKIVRSKDMKNVLNNISNKFPEPFYAIHKMSMCEMINEWKAHNVLCKLSYKKERTCDVDLDINNTKIRKFLYFLLSLISFITY